MGVADGADSQAGTVSNVADFVVLPYFEEELTNFPVA
jgi:hypothetical protein